jgi:FkbH-like protein
MERSPISIVSSSFVLPKNAAWKVLGNYGDVSFADYGDYSGALVRSAPNEVVVFVLFVADLIKDPYAPMNEVDDDLLRPLIELVEQRLARAAAPTILALTSWIPRSIVASAQRGDACEVMSLHLWTSLHRVREDHPNLFLVNLDHELGLEGYSRSFDSRNWYFAHCRLSQHGLTAVARSVAAILERLAQPRKKVLVLDCDNTLWGGVIGEDGLDGIALGEDGTGAAYADFQRAAKTLAKNGVLLAIASKNNEPEVWEVFARHASMILQRADFVSHRIDWSEKAANLTEIADELGLSLDSFVFWDDNPFERAMVQQQLPMVDVVDVPQDVTKWPAMLETLGSLQSLSYTKEDHNKTIQYRSRAEFSKGLATARDKSDFLASIKMVPELHPVNANTLGRAHQLVTKTNQFNLRSVRYSKEEVAALAAHESNICLLGSLSDIYGDHGIVALVVCRRVTERVAFLDTLLMSCRVLGRRFESWILASVADRLRELGVRYLVGEYVPTSKNRMCAAILEAHNFVPLADDHVAALNLRQFETMRDVKGVRYVVDLDNTHIPHHSAMPKAQASAR